MGAKKIENGGEVRGLDTLSAQCVEAGEHSPTGKPGGGYANMLRKGLLGDQPGASGSSNLAPEGSGETGESKITVNGAYSPASSHMSSLKGRIGSPEGFNLPAVMKASHVDSMSGTQQEVWVNDHEDGSGGSDGFMALKVVRSGTHNLPTGGSKNEDCSRHGGDLPHSQDLVESGTKRAPLAEREYRPPALRLNSERVEVEFAFSETADADAPGHPVVLPVSLANSPHATKQILLDPNAKEYTPSPTPSPYPSPCLPPGVPAVALPSRYPDESYANYAPGLELTPLIYGGDIGGAPVPPPYPTPAHIEYGPLTPWEGQPLILPGEGGHLPPVGCESLLLSVGPQSLPQQHSGLRNFSIAQQGMLGTFLPFGVGTPGPSLPAPFPPFAVKEHVSRALLLSGIPMELPEPQLRKTLETWGNIRALAVDRRTEGLVFVQYYDLRHAKEALRDVQHQHLMQQQRMHQRLQLLQKQSGLSPSTHLLNADFEHDVRSHLTGDSAVDDHRHKGMVGGKAVWAQYTSPAEMLAGPDSMNQGTLVVFNVDADMSLESLRQAFEVYGDVKELRETPAKKLHKFVEFFDIRDAARALNTLDGQEIGGKVVKIEFSRPGGQARRHQRAVHCQTQAHEVSDVVPFVDNRLSGPVQGHPLYFSRWSVDGCVSPSRASGSSHMMWASYGAVAAPPIGVVLPTHYQSSLQVPATAQTCISKAGSHVASNRRCFFGRGGRTKGHKLHGANRAGIAEGKLGDPSTCLQEGRPGIANMKGPLRDTPHSQYVFDEGEAVSTNLSCRTTLMIKNIPNKYCQSMLLNLLDDHCKCCNSQKSNLAEPDSAYDFVYLPIDFKNKCNLGYAFVNMTTVQATLRLYKAFHAQQWLAFNSRKVCQVTYARVQGRAALEDHFRNSRFACDTDEYLPLIFSPARTGLVCPPPTVAAGHLMGRTVSQEEAGAEGQRAVR